MKFVTIQIKVPIEWREKVKAMARDKGMNIQMYFKYLIAREEEKKG